MGREGEFNMMSLHRWFVLFVSMCSFLTLTIVPIQKTSAATNPAAMSQSGSESRCDLNKDGKCDHADLELFERSVDVIGRWPQEDAIGADANGDGRIAYNDMRILFPQSKFSNEIAWLDLFEQAEKLVAGQPTRPGYPNYLSREGLSVATMKAKEAFEFAEKVFPQDDPKIAASAGFLGMLYVGQRAYTKAEPLYQRVFHILVQRRGLDTAMDFARILWVPQFAAQWRDDPWVKSDTELLARMESLIKKIIDWEGQHGVPGPRMFMALAELYYRQDDFAQAELWYDKAFDIWTDDRTYPTSGAFWMEHYAEVLDRVGKRSEAKIFKERAKRFRIPEFR